MTDPYVVKVHVARTKSDDLGLAMNSIRSWLDREKIVATEFKTALNGNSYLFTIGFRDIDDANRFREEFSRPAEKAA